MRTSFNWHHRPFENPRERRDVKNPPGLLRGVGGSRGGWSRRVALQRTGSRGWRPLEEGLATVAQPGKKRSPEAGQPRG